MPEHEHPVADELIAKYWPHPDYSKDRVASALDTAAELLRFVNHALINDSAGALPHVQDIQEAAYRLKLISSRMAQPAELLARRLVRMTDEDPTLYATEGDANTHTHAAAEDLNSAVLRSTHVAVAFDEAFNKLGQVGHRLPDEE
ncbi:Hypothetical protein AJAP_42685 (plasmid) [Amycolatopsis japonica]|uniref:Uncharacterized protein n=1 Tax=Amycolatopsis japonica TaxID=208439 RepID=A0A075V9U9_9PSEU|nr:hypothetical protein [Amycolatopsis japonica]AIG81304.1 Hypothetical protein AJAP_42685 [Amycolatopsis japonica]